MISKLNIFLFLFERPKLNLTSTLAYILCVCVCEMIIDLINTLKLFYENKGSVTFTVKYAYASDIISNSLSF